VGGLVDAGGGGAARVEKTLWSEAENASGVKKRSWSVGKRLAKQAHSCTRGVREFVGVVVDRKRWKVDGCRALMVFRLA